MRRNALLGSFLLLITAFGTSVLYAWDEQPIVGPYNQVVALRSGDLDGDGDMDIVAACYSSNHITWYENSLKAGSAFAEHVVTTDTDGPVALQIADVDGDGNLDIFAASGSGVAWYRNAAGDGSVWTEKTITTQQSNAAVAADMDGDGDMDIVVSYQVWGVMSHQPSLQRDVISWFENRNNGSVWVEHVCHQFGPFVSPILVQAADVDGDGDLDILMPSMGFPGMKWFENTDGVGSSWTEHGLTDETASIDFVFSADLDGDGDGDIVSLSSYGKIIRWYENLAGNGSTWAAHDISTDEGAARSPGAAGMDGDGDLDLPLIVTSDKELVWYENPGTSGSLWKRHRIPYTDKDPLALHVADMDGDGHMDLAISSAGSDKVAWLENVAGDGTTWKEHPVRTAFVLQYPTSNYMADVDGDGDLDVFATSWDDHKIACYINSAGDGSQWREQVLSTTAAGAVGVFAADMDGDGDVDALSASETDNKIAWYDNISGDGTSWKEIIISTSSDGPHSVWAGDMDGDGDMDVVSASSYDDAITWYENTNGDGSAWLPHLISNTEKLALSARALDIDKDGDLDVLVENMSGYYNISWYENQTGDGTQWIWHPISAYNVPLSASYAADVDGDGDMDVIADTHDYFTAGCVWYENATVGNPGATWVKHTVYAANADAPVVGFPYAFSAADIDKDGHIDIIATESEAGKVAWYANTSGDGSTWTGHRTPISRGFISTLSSGDVNGDGDPDILAGFTSPAGLSWYKNTLFPLTASVEAHGTIWPRGSLMVSEGETERFFITADEGYHVSDVLVDGVSVGAVSLYTLSRITANHTLSASVAPDLAGAYTLSASAGAQGRISPSGTINIEAGLAQRFAIVADEGYHISDVRVDGVSVGATDSYLFSEVTGNHTISAEFTADTAGGWSISAHAGSGGTVIPSGVLIVPTGGNQDFAVTPDPGYQLSDLVVDGQSLGAVPAYSFSSVTGDHTLFAIFSPLNEAHTMFASATKGGNIYPNGWMIIDSSVGQQFITVADEGYHQSDLIMDGASSGHTGGLTLGSLDHDGTLEAVFYPSEARKTIESATGTGSIDIDVSGATDTYLEDVRAIADTAAELNQTNKPEGYEFPDGLISCKIIRINTSEYTVETAFTYPTEFPEGSKFFIVTDKGFVDYPDVQMAGNRIRVSLTEKGAADNDGYLSDKIVFVGGPAIKASDGTDTNDGSDSSGGSCFITTCFGAF
jgi:FG-GAP-like repeat/Divergent InlB B-repeat domain